VILRRRAVVALCLFSGLSIACGGTAPAGSSSTTANPASSNQSQTSPPQVATSASTPQPVTSAPAAAPTTVAVAPAGTIPFQVASGDSTAIFKVREQLAGMQLPNDAIGTTKQVAGQLVLRPDGSFVSEASKVTVDVRDLRTDQPLRDNFIKSNTLQVNQFPTATLVPVRTVGLPTPLPASGEYTFKLIGQMTIRGVTKELTWDVTARRDGQQVTGTATTSFRFGDFNMTQPRVARVLSIDDEIRLEVQLVANQVS
jgi:polyisoprenoid-binding protein YceI